MPDLLPFADPLLAEVLGALFGHVEPPLLIEVRVLAETGTGGTHRSQQWLPTPADLVAALPALEATADAARAGIYFGVLPRTSKRGTAADAGPGAVAWADLDWKLEKDGESAVRERLAKFPLQPAIVVASGHGLHAYWALKEPESPAVCVELSKRLQLALHGDHVADAARILRIPGTWNHKDAPPVRSRIEVCDLRRAINPDDLRKVTPDPGPIATPAAHAAPGGPKRAPRPSAALPPAELPAEAAALIQGSAKLTDLFVGRGKPEVDADGKPTDRSSSGYDWSLLMTIIAPARSSRRASIRDPAILQAVLAARPDGRAREKGPAYLERTVTQALATARPAPPEPAAHPVDPAEAGEVRRAPKAGADGRRGRPPDDDGHAADAIDFTVDHVTIYDSDPPVYVFTVGGKSIKLSSAELQIAAAFERRYMDALHRLPKMPNRQQHHLWRDLVNGWLATAEVVHQPAEASREHTVRGAIQEFLAGLMCGTEIDDLDRGRGIILENGQVMFKIRTLSRWLSREFRDLGTHAIAGTLREMGITNIRARIRRGEPQVRGWVATRQDANAAEQDQNGPAEAQPTDGPQT